MAFARTYWVRLFLKLSDARPATGPDWVWFFPVFIDVFCVALNLFLMLNQMEGHSPRWGSRSLFSKEFFILQHMYFVFVFTFHPKTHIILSFGIRSCNTFYIYQMILSSKYLVFLQHVVFKCLHSYDNDILYFTSHRYQLGQGPLGVGWSDKLSVALRNYIEHTWIFSNVYNELLMRGLRLEKLSQ